MTDYADLEISLHRRDEGLYDVQLSVEFRTKQADRDDEIRHSEGHAQIDVQALELLEFDPEAYGRTLSQALFTDAVVRREFDQVRAIVQNRGMPLRLRLVIGHSARELHNLHWETLRDPQHDAPLCTGEHLYFSRYLSSQDWRPVRLRAIGALRALAVIPDPADLEQWSLRPVDVAGERERVASGLTGIPVTFLAGEGTAGRATLRELETCLRRSDYDILYLICHGRLGEDGPMLWLEDEIGNVALVTSRDLVAGIQDLAQPPRLVILASCQSAGSGSGDALAAFGPQLAQAGVPAVLAMQGDVSMSTVSRFMQVFFSELQRDGQIDRALAVARGAVRDHPDYWSPVLTMRLRSGRIWYVPGFGVERGEFERWPALLGRIQRTECTPILGHGLVEPLLGSSYEIAQRWAREYRYPLARHECESLPRVAQYLQVHQDDDYFPYTELEASLRQAIQARYAESLPEELRSQHTPIGRLIEAAGAQLRRDDPYEPHKVLAQLNLPIYITTNTDNLLAAALQEAGKAPEVVLCPWNREVEQIESVFDREPNYLPTPERPLVYHLFGRLDHPESLVLAEDDYFDYLIGFVENKTLIPPCVRSAMTNSLLLFLGFQVNDWSFRVLLRSILSREGSGRRLRYQHVAAQLEPDEDRLLEPERALRYLDKYFSGDRNRITLYWGSVHDFMAVLLPRWQAAQQEG